MKYERDGFFRRSGTSFRRRAAEDLPSSRRAMPDKKAGQEGRIRLRHGFRRRCALARRDGATKRGKVRQEPHPTLAFRPGT